MARSWHPDEREANAILAGRTARGDRSSDAVAAFADEVRAQFVQAAPSTVRARHLALVTQAAAQLATDTAGSRPERRPPAAARRRNRMAALTARVAATGFGVLGLTAGLAVAGVDLPAPANDAFRSVGISLPNQAGGDDQRGERAQPSEVSTAVRKVIDGTSDRDCNFGQAVAAAASGRGANPRACAAGAQRRSSRGDARSFGEQTSERARQQREAAPAQRREHGPQTAARARELGNSATRTQPSQAPRGETAPPQPTGAGNSIGRRP